jgi:alanine or glycine:cation symporter, AGCS family
VLAVLLGLVIIGGIRRIAVVAASIVPLMGIFYALGAFAVAASNADQIIPSFISVFRDAFSGSAATGGFLGATFAYAFNRGVNRGLFSNEAGQGSAPIAHAAAKTDEPVSEGMVSILEPFIDTLLICTLTGLVILSSGVWHKKYENSFSTFDMEIIEGSYSDDDPQQVAQLFAHLDIIAPDNDPVKAYNGPLEVVQGRASGSAHTVLHNRSIAEDVIYSDSQGPYTGTIEVSDGAIVTAGINVAGRSLLHSVPLTAKAFEQSFLGEYGQYAVTIGLVMFAFSTALAWSYYGDRGVTYLFGLRYVGAYRILYVLGFFAATIADTSLVWLISAVTLALMAIPNLIGLLLMRREVKSLTNEYWQKVKNKQIP